MSPGIVKFSAETLILGFCKIEILHSQENFWTSRRLTEGKWVLFSTSTGSKIYLLILLSPSMGRGWLLSPVIEKFSAEMIF